METELYAICILKFLPCMLASDDPDTALLYWVDMAVVEVAPTPAEDLIKISVAT
jgi:hypothetical protein